MSTAPFVTSPWQTAWPAPPLRRYISHYWLSLNNTDRSHVVLPDGAVDLVIELALGRYRVDVFGTTLSRVELPLERGGHYLGIRFRPGQSRHFLDMDPVALTHTQQPGDSPLARRLLSAASGLFGGASFTRLDALLLAQWRRHPPRHARIDDVLQRIEAAPAPMPVSTLVAQYGRSRRQFERQFLGVVGIPAKLFIEIVRFRRAGVLLAHPAWPLAQVAAASGYSDQSHMSRQFSRFCGMPPSRARRHVAFVQECPPTPGDHHGF